MWYLSQLLYDVVIYCDIETLHTAMSELADSLLNIDTFIQNCNPHNEWPIHKTPKIKQNCFTLWFQGPPLPPGGRTFGLPKSHTESPPIVTSPMTKIVHQYRVQSTFHVSTIHVCTLIINTYTMHTFVMLFMNNWWANNSFCIHLIRKGFKIKKIVDI